VGLGFGFGFVVVFGFGVVVVVVFGFGVVVVFGVDVEGDEFGEFHGLVVHEWEEYGVGEGFL
jgi:hypothetical protein